MRFPQKSKDLRFPFPQTAKEPSGFLGRRFGSVGEPQMRPQSGLLDKAVPFRFEHPGLRVGERSASFVDEPVHLEQQVA